jgi:type II secretory pathway pseudopilin PulG
MSIQPMAKAAFNRNRASGLALIELMVALTIGMVLALGILVLMSSTSRSYKVNDEYARMQENGVSAIRYMGDDIRMAGFYGLAASVQSMQTFDLDGNGFIDYASDAGLNFGTTAAQDCGATNRSLDATTPITGLAAGTTPAAATAALPCIAAANYVQGPALIVRGALGTMVNGASVTQNGVPTIQPQNWTTAQLNANTIYVQADPFIGYVFPGSMYDNYKAATYSRFIPVAGGYVDAPIYVFQSHIYYIRPCSRPTGGLVHGNATCQAADDGGTPIPTLVRQEWQSQAGGPTLVETGLVEGIEQMGVLYGFDNYSAGNVLINPQSDPTSCESPGQCANSPDGVVDSFTAVPPVAATNAPQHVVAIRLNFLVRSTAPTKGYDDSPKTYDLGGGVTWNCTAAVAPCNYHRHIFSQQVQVKNAALRRGG